MQFRTWAAAAAVAVAMTASAAGAGTVTVDMGASAQDFTLWGQGAISPGVGSFTIGQGAGSYNAGTNTSTYVLSGTITGGSTGYSSGSYSLVTTFAGTDTPEAGPNAPFAQSNPSNINFFYYDGFDPSTTMTLYLTGTPTGSHVIPLVTGGVFDGPGFGFGFVTASCTGVASCTQNNVGLTPGASISGPVDVSASFSATPEPAVWAMMILGLGAVGVAMRRRERALAA